MRGVLTWASQLCEEICEGYEYFGTQFGTEVRGVYFFTVYVQSRVYLVLTSSSVYLVVARVYLVVARVYLVAAVIKLLSSQACGSDILRVGPRT